ncbi:hypothetical protein D3C72_1897320 [compost metagenome]
MARIVVQRVAFIHTRFLLAVVVGVVRVRFQILSDLPVAIQLDTVNIRFADVKVFIDGIGFITVHFALVGGGGFANRLLGDFVLKLGVEDGAVQRYGFPGPVEARFGVEAFLWFQIVVTHGQERIGRC